MKNAVVIGATSGIGSALEASLKAKALMSFLSLVLDLKPDFEQFYQKLASNIGLFSATDRVALNHDEIVSHTGLEPFSPIAA